jgi:hypothetical protein
MTCTDYERHELLLLSCTHTGRDGAEVQVSFTDGCSGRVCSDCDRELRLKHSPDLAGRVTGRAPGLDALQLLRAAERRKP